MKREVTSPLTASAETAALGPGTTVTVTPWAAHKRTRSSPGSEIQGMPASETDVYKRQVYNVPISHGEGRFICNPQLFEQLKGNGQIATQYVDLAGQPTYDLAYNPNESYMAVEGITSPDGRVFGKMAHSERIGKNICKNVYGEKDQKIFLSGVELSLIHI